MTPAELEEFLDKAFPALPRTVSVEHVGERTIRLRRPVGDTELRPGGTVSGPTLMALADTVAYLGVVAEIGPVALAVTTSLHMDFVRKPRPVDLVADGRLVKLGKRLAVSQVSIHCHGDDPAEPVAVASVTYSIPADR